MLACMLDEREMGSIQQEQKRIILQNNYYLMSVSLQFGRRLWNTQFVGFKLPANELKNAKIKYTATLKTAGTCTNTKHTPLHKEITDVQVCAWPTIILFPNVWELHPSAYSISWPDTNTSSTCYWAILHLMPGFHCESGCTTRSHEPTTHLIGRLSLDSNFRANNSINTSLCLAERMRTEAQIKNFVFCYLRTTTKAETILDCFSFSS